MQRLLILVSALAVVAAGCGADTGGTEGTTPASTTSTPPTSTNPPASDDLILQVVDEGGFVPVEWLLTRVSRFSLYADGMLLAPAVVAEIFPGPVLAPIQSVRLGEANLRDVEVLIDAIGLRTLDRVIDDRLAGIVADAGTTVVTYFDEAGDAHSYGAYALGLETDQPAPDATLNLALLIEMLDGLLGAGNEAGIYEPDRLEVWVGEGPIYEPEFVTTVPWPLAAAPDDFESVSGFDQACRVLEGDEARNAVDAFAEANQATVWEYETVVYHLLARPLLPGESGCGA
jgi:hypothetical protein